MNETEIQALLDAHPPSTYTCECCGSVNTLTYEWDRALGVLVEHHTDLLTGETNAVIHGTNLAFPGRSNRAARRAKKGRRA